MKIKIWNEESKKDEDGYFYLRMRYGSDERLISIYICDKEGNQLKDGSLVLLIENVLVICEGVSDKIPVKTDFYGKTICISEAEYSREIDRQEANIVKKHIINCLAEREKEESTI